MTTRGSRSNNARCRAPTSPTRSERRAVGQHEQVVSGVRVRVGPDPLDAVEEGIQRRHRVRADGIRPAPEPLDETNDAERGPERVGIGVSCETASTRRAPRSRSTTTSGTASRYGDRSTVIATSAVPRCCPSTAHDRDAAAVSAGSQRTAVLRSRRPHVRHVRWASAASRPAGSSMLGSACPTRARRADGGHAFPARPCRRARHGGPGLA